MIDPKILASLVALAAIFTECVMRFTPKSLDRKRFGLPISIVSGIVTSIVWSLIYSDIPVGQAIIRGLFVAGTASGAFDTIKTIGVHAKGKA